MKKKLIALLMGVTVATSGMIYTSASASELDSSANYNIEEIKPVLDPELEAQRIGKAIKAVGKGLGKAWEEAKSWALWDAMLGDNTLNPAQNTIDTKDAEVIFDK